MEGQLITANGIRTKVTATGEGTPLLCLHGWAASHESFTELRKALEHDPVRLIVPDLPGCGETEEPPVPWGLPEYVDWLEEIVSTLHVPRFSLLGHSHGGRIAISYAATQPQRLDRLYLCAAAGIYHQRDVTRDVGAFLSRCGHVILGAPGFARLRPLAQKFLRKILRAHDYDTATPMMRATMGRVLAEDMTSHLPMIQVPTEIFWGEDDATTPLSDANLLNKKIVHSRLHVFPSVRHAVHRERAREIAEVLRATLVRCRAADDPPHPPGPPR